MQKPYEDGYGYPDEHRSRGSAVRRAPIPSRQPQHADPDPNGRRARLQGMVAQVRQTQDDPQVIVPEQRVSRRKPKRLSPLFLMAFGLIVAVIVGLVVTQVFAWGQNEYNNIVYGTPRTFQTDAVVGHNDSTDHPSHFVAINYRGQVSVLEWPGGDPGKLRLLATYNLIGNADAVVTLKFITVSGKVDIIVNAGSVASALINDGSTYRNPTEAEQQQIQQALTKGGN